MRTIIMTAQVPDHLTDEQVATHGLVNGGENVTVFSVVTDEYGATYTPWTDRNGWALGFKVQRDGQTRYVYLNPSSGSDAEGEDQSVAFLYEGVAGDPSADEALTHLDIFTGA